MAITKDPSDPAADDEPTPRAAPDVEAEEAVAKHALEKALGRGEEGRDLPRDVGETDAPTQLGYKRFVYAAYFGGAIGVAFLGSKIGNLIWYRLSQWKPAWGLGEPNDEMIMVVSAALGAGLAVFYWRKKSARTYIEEVAQELSNVTWPSRKEVINSTGVVVFTTLFATAFFALMDQFWRYVTDKIYSF